MRYLIDLFQAIRGGKWNRFGSAYRPCHKNNHKSLHDLYTAFASQKWAFMKHVLRHRRNITHMATVATKLRSAQAHDAQEQRR